MVLRRKRLHHVARCLPLRATHPDSLPRPVLHKEGYQARVTNARERACFPGTHEAMKNKIDHCSVTNQRQHMNICVLKWASDARSLGSGARAAARQGVKKTNPGGGLGRGPFAENRQKTQIHTAKTQIHTANKTSITASP